MFVWGIFPNSCYAGVCPSQPQHNHVLPGPGLCGQSSTHIHFSMGNKHTAELGCFTGEVPHICYNFMDTKFNKLTPGSKQLSKCLLGKTASWDNFGSRSRFMSQLTRGLLGAKASLNICLPLTQWNVLVLETILKRMWMLCTSAFHVIKWFLVS